MEESLLNDSVNENQSVSLLDGATEVQVEGVESSPLSLVGDMDGNVNSFSSDAADEILNEQRKEMEVEERKKFFLNPDNQAEIIFNNFIRNSERVYGGPEKRRIKRDILRNAKKGKYNKMFNEQIYGISKEESQKRFEALNQ